MPDEAGERGTGGSVWQAKQVYTMAVVCLLLLLSIGYIFRGSKSPAPPLPEAAGTQPPAMAGAMGGHMPSLDQMKQMADRKAAPLLEIPDLGRLMLLVLAAVAVALYLVWRKTGNETFIGIAKREELDRITYKTIAIAVPLPTLMIAAGKETWAAITWLVYAGYLHMRVTRGWRGRRAAYFAILGFAVVMFTFFGVTYLLPGMNAYA
jgi:ABC-type transport system involved in cytochrome c biogenesis permease subunit